MKTAFIYSDDFAKYDYGPEHPLKPVRLKLTHDLIRAYGLLSLQDVRVVEAKPAEEDDLLLYHTRDYIEMLKAVNSGLEIPDEERYGLGFGDNPVFEGVFEWSRLVTGASLQAVELVDSGEVPIAFNISGGLHHALASRASGFCYINDPVIVISSLLKKGRRVVYIDIDAHHGDGVQEVFYRTDKVLTISLHESGRYLFPGTGFESEIGEEEGRGYSVNIPMPPSSDDELFVYAFNKVVPSLIERFRPDIVVGQLGVDSFLTDPLTHLNYTTNGFCEVVRKMKDLSPKWIALGGGGYEITNVAKAWTLAWAIMNNIDPPDKLPEAFFKQYPLGGFRSRKLRDEEYQEKGAKKEMIREEVERVVARIKEKVFPLINPAT
ncbi:MAG TPA: acetoin utilization protein AcuC [Thermodesulfovibrionales bacterium]|nr:acetoin utilization protein AcuC [Thermodesulfovibrionales bacterium]